MPIYTAEEQLPQRQYDFIIIGGGTAGNVLANRLSENSDISVLIIEAGADTNDNLPVQVPFLSVTLSGSEIDWKYKTVPQAGLNGRVIPCARGRALGGSSAINLLTYNRGSDDIWDHWAKLTDDQSWSWSKIQRYYLKNSRLVAPADGRDTNGEVDPLVHGDGPLEVSVPGHILPIDDLVVQSSKQLGGRFKYNSDFNSGDCTGVGFMQSTIGNGVRSDSNTAYLQPAASRPNLHILLNTHITRLIHSVSANSGPIFTTVELGTPNNKSERTQVSASKEVILSAGVIGTPQILQLSGIGDASALRSLNITPVLDLPDVGAHLADHPLVANYFKVSSEGTWDNVLRDGSVLGANMGQWQSSRQGLFVDSPGNTQSYQRLPPDSSAFDGISDPSSGPKSAHTELIFINGFAQFGETPPPTSGNYVTVLSIVASPTSRGSVTLASNDPFAHPSINPAILTTNFDVQAMVQAMNDAQTFLAAEPWQKDFKPVVFGELANAKTDADKADLARKTAVTVNHPAGTARMSPVNAKWGVVDPELKVKGTKGLRVVDASIFPVIPECHIQAAVYIIAERAADLIKTAYGL
ncbi:hypothetical protein QCA50_011264 [Cerrena zonata]|uniref:Glucose-methanol-choline oxidoreductase N-terminal domain-containing protein n=1 Tax=Cerrena zonata TaxID=2478898 RepID=A0AAW0FWW5_9APHY